MPHADTSSWFWAVALSAFPIDAADQIQEGRLTGTVGADQAGNGACLYAERDVINGAQRTEGLDEPLYPKDRNL
jgi:hypothetical protein